LQLAEMKRWKHEEEALMFMQLRCHWSFSSFLCTDYYRYIPDGYATGGSTPMNSFAGKGRTQKRRVYSSSIKETNVWINRKAWLESGIFPFQHLPDACNFGVIWLHFANECLFLAKVLKIQECLGSWLTNIFVLGILS
jgi:hypothetical protein